VATHKRPAKRRETRRRAPEAICSNNEKQCRNNEAMPARKIPLHRDSASPPQYIRVGQIKTATAL
jgi:hypothetical protein